MLGPVVKSVESVLRLEGSVLDGGPDPPRRRGNLRRLVLYISTFIPLLCTPSFHLLSFLLSSSLLSANTTKSSAFSNPQWQDISKLSG